MMQLDEMFVESKICPLGIDVTRPAFGWSYKSSSVRFANANGLPDHGVDR